MRVFVGMECSGTIRRAFQERGHVAYSCDLKPSEDGETVFHLQEDAFEACERIRPHLAIFHPDCRFLSSSGYHWCYRDPEKYPTTVCGAARILAVSQGVAAFMRCVSANVAMVCVENPIGIMNTRYRKPDQIIQPYMFGEDASKATCLWLKNLPPLISTLRIPGRMTNGRERWSNQTDNGQNRLGPSDGRATERARTYPGWARAMAEQWGAL